MATIGKFNNSTRPGERQAFPQRPLLPPVQKRTVASIARANNEKQKGFSPTELAREARTHRNPKAELRALAGRPLGENSGESMNKETYKEYIRQRLNEGSALVNAAAAAFRSSGIQALEANKLRRQATNKLRRQAKVISDTDRDMKISNNNINDTEREMMAQDAKTAASNSSNREAIIRQEIDHERIKKQGDNLRGIIDQASTYFQSIKPLRATPDSNKPNISDSEEILDIKRAAERSAAKSTDSSNILAAITSKALLNVAIGTIKTNSLSDLVTRTRNEEESRAQQKIDNSPAAAEQRMLASPLGKGMSRNAITGKWEYHPG
jgi:hypothetical protein